MEERIKRIIEIVIGILFIILGIIGLFLPFLQGILFILIGIALITHKSFKKIVLSLRKKYKKRN